MLVTLSFVIVWDIQVNERRKETDVSSDYILEGEKSSAHYSEVALLFILEMPKEPIGKRLVLMREVGQGAGSNTH